MRVRSISNGKATSSHAASLQISSGWDRAASFSDAGIAAPLVSPHRNGPLLLRAATFDGRKPDQQYCYGEVDGAYGKVGYGQASRRIGRAAIDRG
jgi:hypothetical protein